MTEVAAVTMDVQSSPAGSKRSTTTIWYTKHEASSTEQVGFIRAVVDISQRANDGEDLKAQYAALSELIDHPCNAKIASRITRVIDTRQRRGNLRISDAPSDLVRENLTKLCSVQVLPQHRFDGPWSSWLEGLMGSSFGRPMPRNSTELWSI